MKVNDNVAMFVVPKYSIHNLKAGHVYEVIETIEFGSNDIVLLIINDIGLGDIVSIVDPRFDVYYQVRV